MLHVPVGANSFSQTVLSVTGRPAPAFGTSVIPSTTAYGNWSELVAATSADSYGVLVLVNSNTASNTVRNTVVNIGVDAAGGNNYVPIIPDLMCGGASTYTAGNGVWFYFPVYVPSGSSIAAQAYGSATTAIRVAVNLPQLPPNPSAIRKGSYVESIGVNGGRVGQTIVPGTTNEGSWTLVGTTANRLWWWQLALQNTIGDSAWGANAINIDLAIGDGSNYDIIIQDLSVTTTTAEAMTNPPLTFGVEWDVPAGSMIYARAQVSGTPDQYTIAAYGCGG